MVAANQNNLFYERVEAVEVQKDEEWKCISFRPSSTDSDIHTEVVGTPHGNESTIRLHLVGGKLLVFVVVYVCMFYARHTWKASLQFRLSNIG